MTGSEAAGLETEPLDYRMNILLSLRGFRIKQIDKYHASMDLLTGYTLQIDVREKQGSWIIAKETPEEYHEASFSEFTEPKAVRDNALVLMDAYKGALIDYSINAEERTLEEPIPGNLPRTRKQGKGPRVVSPEDAEKEVKAAREAAQAKTQAEYKASTGAGEVPDPREGPGLSAEKPAAERIPAKDAATAEPPGFRYHNACDPDPLNIAGNNIAGNNIADPDPSVKSPERSRKDPGTFPAGKDKVIIQLLNKLLQPGPNDPVIKTEFKQLPVPN